ncbi:hypothetical protein ERO13_A06G130502v2 [Gossypium hirsutum]|uniref:Uncharacterized protein n=2 Tax=Gossypium TaxID=3633 RepID=A0A5J5VDA4_GOSBA|nr:hypothetical protein ES319_A06G132400v1 [Gossypium barbadense]KAG4195655.1 hypothetical protein ERO13_A06G130502v2 [Gossypium hirsutum]TYH13559.1 hypothetical protein ES288_A06G148100v1 [Gossypium darwinii]
MTIVTATTLTLSTPYCCFNQGHRRFMLSIWKNFSIRTLFKLSVYIIFPKMPYEWLKSIWFAFKLYECLILEFFILFNAFLISQCI